jgi:uncharacterized protein YbbK (DUF523 family)
MPPRLLVSACLCGQACRYDGAAKALAPFARLVALGEALPVCPELLGGLPVPREPCELVNGRALTRVGQDNTAAYLLGAEKTLALAQRHGIRLAVLKERSPSCGVSAVYDGTFTGTCINGEGLTTALLRRAGMTVFSEENAPEELLRSKQHVDVT